MQQGGKLIEWHTDSGGGLDICRFHQFNPMTTLYLPAFSLCSHYNLWPIVIYSRVEL